MRRLLVDTVDWAGERKQFGERILDFQGISFPLADSATECTAARLLTYLAAQSEDDHADPKLVHARASMAKLYASEAAWRCADRCVQTFGGRGYMRTNVAERFLRELRVDRIWEGTSEIQRLIVARALERRGVERVLGTDTLDGASSRTLDLGARPPVYCLLRKDRYQRMAHPKDRSGITRRQLLRGAAGAAVLAAGGGVLAGCENTTDGSRGACDTGGGTTSKLVVPKPVGPLGLPLPRTDNSVTWALLDDNKAIRSGLAGEGGTLHLYNYADYINPGDAQEVREGVQLQACRSRRTTRPTRRTPSSPPARRTSTWCSGCPAARSCCCRPSG